MENIVKLVTDSDKTQGVHIFILRGFFLLILGLTGVFFDIIFTKFRKNTKINQKLGKDYGHKLSLDVAQLFFGILYIYILKYFFSSITDTFQRDLVGMYFPALFFSIQYNMFVDIQENINFLLDIPDFNF